MSDVTYKRFAIVVMDREQPHGWRERFLGQLARGRITLDGSSLGDAVTLQGEDLRLDDEWVGVGQFESLESVDAALSTWISLGSRPFIGAPVGLFVWSHFLANGAQERAIGRVLARVALGPGYRFDTRQLREHVVRRKFRLTQMTSRFGFDEGTALIERQPGAYIDDVMATIKWTLAEQQIDVWAGFDLEADGNNPLRIYPPMEIAGKPVPAGSIDDILYSLEVDIWAFREELRDPDDSFWIDADP